MQTSRDFLFDNLVNSQNSGPVHIEPRPFFLREGYSDYYRSDVWAKAVEHCKAAEADGIDPWGVIESLGGTPTLNSTWEDAVRAVETVAIQLMTQATEKQYTAYLKTL